MADTGKLRRPIRGSGHGIVSPAQAMIISNPPEPNKKKVAKRAKNAAQTALQAYSKAAESRLGGYLRQKHT